VPGASLTASEPPLAAWVPRQTRLLFGAMNATLPSLALTALLAAGLSACSDAAGAGTARSAPAPPARDASTKEADMLPQRGKVHVTTRDGRELQLDVEIASDDLTRARGLMFRRSLPEMAGMIFVFPTEQRQSFWMKNTLIPLDMLFIDSAGRVVGIVENAEPMTITSRAVEAASKFVLEVNGGWCSRHGVEPGAVVRLEGMYDLR
jgi:uncharacterized membrane protein (UPF0127 family)